MLKLWTKDIHELSRLFRPGVGTWCKCLSLRREFATNCQKSDVRVRFAPSPTGFLHLGGLRTALYNFLFARSQNGSFLLRIEDTDQSRTVTGAVTKLQESLAWAGIHPDEGPDIGGNFGPYMQSERLSLYREHVDILLESGWAYPCFCTARRLEILRRDAARRGEPSKYDNRCRGRSQQEVQELIAQGVPYVIRLKLQPTPDPWNDLVMGRTVHDIGDIEGDPILLKTDGYPTYHLANVVDDYHMRITHVLRGSEWLSSTPKHILLYKAFGWHPPSFGHMPLILNQDGSKLSKRQDDLHVQHFMTEGFFPQAVLNYITTVGGGFSQNTLSMSLQEMSENFDLSKVRTNAGRLDPAWLIKANRQMLEARTNSEDFNEVAQLVTQVKDLVIQKYWKRLQDSKLKGQILSHDYILKVIRWTLIDDRTSSLKDFLSPELEFLWVTPDQSQLSHLISIETDASSLLSQCVTWLEGVEDFSVENLTVELKAFTSRHKLSGKIFFPFFRAALTGSLQGPPVAEMLAVFGKENTLARLHAAEEGLSNL